jgi:hypothetical protein
MLIEVFTDYVVNKKSLREYVEVRKTINERGEFNDAKLILAQDNLERLKEESPQIYEKMYKVLSEIIKKDAGHKVEYPLDFVRAILKMYKNNKTPEMIYEEYKGMLEHKFQTLN